MKVKVGDYVKCRYEGDEEVFLGFVVEILNESRYPIEVELNSSKSLRLFKLHEVELVGSIEIKDEEIL